LIGAGGAARAALYHLKPIRAARSGIVNRTAKARGVGPAILARSRGSCLDDAAAFEGASLGHQRHLFGMTGQPPLEVDLSATASDALVFDMVYAPLEDAACWQSRRIWAGRRTADGLIMLIGQARPSFEAFFGAPPPER
jgi:shikimate dehydrogenase